MYKNFDQKSAITKEEIKNIVIEGSYTFKRDTKGKKRTVCTVCTMCTVCSVCTLTVRLRCAYVVHRLTKVIKEEEKKRRRKLRKRNYVNCNSTQLSTKLSDQFC